MNELGRKLQLTTEKSEQQSWNETQRDIEKLFNYIGKTHQTLDEVTHWPTSKDRPTPVKPLKNHFPFV